MNAAAFLLLGSIVLVPGYGAESLLQWTMRNEGFRSDPYKDTTGHWTVGYGHRVREGHAPVTETEAKRTLLADLQTAQARAERVIPGIESEPTAVKFVITALCFQVGETGTRKFHLMLAAIHDHHYEVAGSELRSSVLHSQCPRRTEELAVILETAAQ